MKLCMEICLAADSARLLVSVGGLVIFLLLLTIVCLIGLVSMHIATWGIAVSKPCLWLIPV